MRESEEERKAWVREFDRRSEEIERRQREEFLKMTKEEQDKLIEAQRLLYKKWDDSSSPM